MNLHLDRNNFEGAIVAAADYFQIPEIFIEKDNWVTYALPYLYNLLQYLIYDFIPLVLSHLRLATNCVELRKLFIS
jgi:hypothetical protein